MTYDQLKLSSQLCFPLYALSRLITKEYKPYLNKLGLTYPQYIVLMALWENDSQSVVDIADKLLLQTNTITPLLKRMSKEGLINRTRDLKDERKVIISLTAKGKSMREKAKDIPFKMRAAILSDDFTTDDLELLKSKLHTLIQHLKE